MSSNTNNIQQLYVAYFSRPADATGLAYWETVVAAQNGSTTAVSAAFAASAEYTAAYAGLSNDQIVNTVYTNLFGHSADVAGLTYWSNLLTGGKITISNVVTQIAAGALTTDATALTQKVAASVAFTVALDTTAEILGYSGTGAIAAAKAWLAGVTDATTEAAALTTLNATIASLATIASGQTYTLTTGLDNIVGTSGSDTIIGDFTATSLFNLADQINGGSGNDTLKLYGTYDSAKLPLTISSVETFEFVVPGNVDINLTTSTKAATGLTKVVVDDVSAANSKTITTTAGQSLSLATGAAGTVLAGTLTWAGSATDTTLDLTLNGFQFTAGGTKLGLDVTGAAAKTLNIHSTGSNSNTVGAAATSYLTGPTTVTKHVIDGSANLTYYMAAADAAKVTVIDASAATGKVKVDTSTAAKDATFTFTGGSGNDTLVLAANDLHTILLGSQLAGGAGTGDTLTIKDLAPTAADYTALNATTGFEILGLGASGITIDASKLTGAMATHYTIGTLATETITNVLNGTIVDVTGGIGTKLTVSPLTGQQSATINLNTSVLSPGFTVVALDTTGLGSPTITSNGSSANTITTLTLTANSGTVLTGANSLTISNVVGGATGDSFDASAFTGDALTLGIIGAANTVATGVGTSGRGDIIKLGSGTNILVQQETALTSNGDTITLLAGHTNVNTIDSTYLTTLVKANAHASAAQQQTAITKIYNFNTGAVASDILKASISTAAVGSISDLNTSATHVYANAGSGFVTSSGVTAAQFLADVALSSVETEGHVYAFTDGTDTYVVSVDKTSTVLAEHITELVGVHTATSLSLTAAANAIHIA